MKPVKDVPDSNKSPSLRRWRVMETLSHRGAIKRHVYGHDITNDTARVSTSIDKYDRETMTITTHSGSIYKLLGAPGHSRGGTLAWKIWCSNNDVAAEKDVTKEYFDLDKLFSNGSTNDITPK